GIGRALQDDKLAAAQVRANRFSGARDVRQVRLARLGQRRWHADDDGVGLAEALRVTRGVEPAGRDHFPDTLGADVADVALALLQLRDFVPVDVETEHGVARPGKRL